MPDPYKKINEAMTKKPAPKSTPKTVVTGPAVAKATGPSKDPAIRAEIARRMAAQKLADANRMMPK